MGINPNNSLVVKALTDLLNLLSDPNQHTRGAYARDKSGTPTGANSHNAVCFCLMGGLHRIFVRKKVSAKNRQAIIALIEKVMQGAIAVNDTTDVGDNLDLIDFNDRYTHEEVIEVITQARQKAWNQILHNLAV